MQARMVIRRHSRGAVFVEAVIVVSVMILMLLGMVFFRTFYLTQMRASRVARASVLAFSMGGCDDKGGASAWAGGDLQNTATPTRAVSQTSQPATPPPGVAPAPTSSGVTSVLGNVPGAPVGGNALFPIANMGLQVNVEATTTSGPTNPRRGIQHQVSSQSYVVCGEEMKDGNIMDVMRFARDLIKFDAQPKTPANYVEDPPPDLPPEYVDP